jgi:RNA polymerase sigma-70 factor (ECF subfamily)
VTDVELLLASRQDPAAFRELYDRWAQRLLAYFYRRVFDAEVAADLLAETFAVAYERRHRFRDVGKPGSAWLFGIAQKELDYQTIAARLGCSEVTARGRVHRGLTRLARLMEVSR